MNRLACWLILILLLPETGARADVIFWQCGETDAPKPLGTIIPGHNIKILTRPAPTYPPEAKAKKIEGSFTVAVIFDEEGKVIWAKANAGHPLLKQAAVEAACGMHAKPQSIGKTRVKFYGIGTYKFVLN